MAESGTSASGQTWILVAGTGARFHPLDEKQKQTCVELGESLAREGYGMVTGGWRGVDELTARSFDRELTRIGFPLQGRLTQIVADERLPPYAGGKLILVRRGEEEWTESVKSADAVVLIGGVGGTWKVGDVALELGRAVFPLADTGGDAAKFYMRMQREWNPNFVPGIDRDRFQVVAREAPQVVPELIKLLNQWKRPRAAFRPTSIDKAPTNQERRSEVESAASQQPRYYVSYAWSDEGKDRDTIVDRLCDEAELRGKTILRDKKVQSFGDSISKFMQDIGKGDRVFVILSDKYLKSPFCMFELFELWRNCKQDEAEFLKRCRVFTLDDAKIWDMAGRLNYAGYWKTRYDQIDRTIKKDGVRIIGGRDFIEFKKMQDFVNHVGDVLATFADIVQPRSFEDLVRYGFENPPEAATA